MSDDVGRHGTETISLNISSLLLLFLFLPLFNYFLRDLFPYDTLIPVLVQLT